MEHEWPELPLAAWEPTRHTLHMWTQVVGKVKLAMMPPVNHWWHSALYVSARGLTTGAMHCPGGRLLELEFDFIDHLLRFRTDGEARAELPLRDGLSVTEFYRQTMRILQRQLDVPVRIWPVPVEVPEPIPFAKDDRSSFDAEYAQRFWRALVAIEDALAEYRGEFVGKSSPVHFFWGSFDLALTRFSGRPAPERPELDVIMREGYSHELISFGFWPGGQGYDASFYAYAAPEPEGFKTAVAQPAAATYDTALSEFVLPYEAVRTSADPAVTLRSFAQSVYVVAADLGSWDRAALERQAAAQV